jgi:Tol biopolymer transport system component
MRQGVLLAALLAAWPTVEGGAQYFGRNKVQHQSFDFQVLTTDRFKVYFYERERDAALLATRMAERWYDRLAGLLRDSLSGRQPLILYASHPEFAQTTAIPGEIGEGTGGVTEAFKRRIVLPMQGALRETDHVIGHELVHAFQYDLSGVGSAPLTSAPSISYLPLWAVEGLAEYLSIGPRSTLTGIWLRDGLRQGRLPDLGDLESPEWFPYRWGHALWAYIGGRWGDDAVWRLFREAARRRDIRGAIDSILGVRPDTLIAAWHRAISATYQPLDARTSGADQTGTLLTDNERGSLHVAPALSPDGTRLIYLSSRDPFAIDLYLADGRTGRVLRRLTESALDPHFEALGFVGSAGSWSADGERIAYAAQGEGKPSLVIARAEDGRREQVHELERFGAIYNPTWSPEGDRIAFVANEGGFLDLWVLTLATGALTPLTRDRFAELHPSWSPDGRRIAITTDRFGAGYSLALVSVPGGEVTRVAAFPGATSISPQWAPGGEALYFVSDPDGIPNVYRVGVGGGTPVPITRVFTGVTGLTELSPALAVAAQSGDIVFAAFTRGGHRLYRLDPATGAVAAAPAGDGAILPPARRADGRLAATLEGGALPEVSPAVSDYRPGLSLDYVAPPTLGFAVGGGSSFFGGGVAMGFGDMLGYHALDLQLQAQVVNGEVLNGLGAQASYVNQRQRANWGFVAGQMPLLSQGFAIGFVDADGDGRPEILEQTLTFWEVSRHAIGLFRYPFSTTTRLELSGGFERLSYDAQIENRFFDPVTGEPLDEERRDAPPCGDSLSIRQNLCNPGAISQVRGSAALVHDRSILGPMGPIRGTRWRLEAAPSFGSLDFLTVLGDWRGYLRLARPLTFATRAMHYGRYLEGAEDQRLAQLFLGYPTLIRGYDNGSFNLNRCPQGQPTQSCSEVQVYDQLFGSRLALANAELRMALFGPTGLLGYSFLPADLIGFFDAGLAWSEDRAVTLDRDERAWFLGGDREPLTSAGVGIRLNLLGFAMAELVWVRPFDRPLRKGYLSFNLTSAF